MANGNLIATGNTHSRAEQYPIANGHFPFSLSSPPNTNLYALSGFPNRGKGVPNVDVVTRNIDPPRVHNIRAISQGGAAWAQEVIYPGFATIQPSFFHPVGAQICAHN